MQIDSTDDFGATLKATREATGRSLRDVADVTKLALRTLDALERNQIDRLPTGIFRRAVVRAYAREVGLDPEATLKAFLVRHPDTLPPPGAGAAVIVDAAPDRRARAVVTIIGILIAVIVLVAVAGYLAWPRVGVGLVHPKGLGAWPAAPGLPLGLCLLAVR